MPVDGDLLRTLASRFDGSRPSLRPFLRAVQSELFWIPREALELAADKFNLSYATVYEEASFNPEFSLEPRGRHVIAVCRGLSCTEYGSKDILKAFEKALGLREGETTADKKATLCTQHCFGLCAMGPNVKVDRHIASNFDLNKLTDILKALD